MIQLLTWEIAPQHREHWPPEYYYSGFGFGRPFCLRGTLKFGTDDFG